MKYPGFLFRCIAAMASISAAGAAQALPRYKVESMGVLPGDVRSFGIDINNRGEAVGLSSSDSGGNAVIFKNGVLQSLNVNDGGTYSVAIEINDHGQVAGSAPGPGDANINPYIYTNGKANFFAPDSGVDGEVYGLNNHGHAVGRLGDQAYFYDGSRLHILQYSGRLLQAADINDSGLIAGTLIATVDHPAYQPFLYDGTQYTFLPSPSSYAQPASMNNAGQVVGVSTDSQGNYRATLWENGRFEWVTAPRFKNASASDINENGWILGNFSLSAQSDISHVFLHADGVTRDLNHLLLPSDAAQWQLNFAYGINDAGQIAGTGLLNGQTVGFVATPVPEPASLVLMLAGLGACGLKLKRKSATGSL